ncbi:MAG: helix-turn-helix transcriptional regulator [Acidimicrobiales bacterium]
MSPNYSAAIWRLSRPSRRGDPSRARIAAGLSQRELAERLGVVEQQVQRYEANEYASTSSNRLRDVVSVLRQSLARPSASVPA